MVVVVLTVLLVVGLAVAGALIGSGVLPLGKPMAIPEVGTCYADKHGNVKDLLATLPCTDPAADRKITKSAIVTDTDVVVQCEKLEKLEATEGTHYGSSAVAHSCVVPNLIEGYCYDALYVRESSCGEFAAKFDRTLSGVTDTDLCAPEVAEPGYGMAWIAANTRHFVDPERRVTYCFVPGGY
ncbi:MAG TPA: hypothetical protein VK083_04885 [Nocardia sp.]|uniref:hypothetical protein n=1 Tax=Nocardia TaxID=1817 RepID=UPI00245750B1|nr:MULTISPECIES: hypothetical protein [Nocardia]HLS76112.1 hypothetical protein [Nocardia sp.]